MLEEMLSALGLEEEAALEDERASKMDAYDHELLNRWLAEIGW